MSVVYRESSRKMTPKNKLLVLFVTIGWIETVTGAAYSNVVVQRADVVPVEYINYNPSLAYENGQIAQLSASPLESIIPSVSTLVSPCVSPCVISNVPGGSLTPIASSSNAKIITYKPSVPNVPVVVTNKEAARGYQYAYAVYDDHTGDKKTQSEHSDGSVVQGQYSFIQPDGIRREVVYTADDLKGFNAVVRNISPEHEQPKEQKGEVVKSPVPCTDPHNEHLTHHASEDHSSEEEHGAEHHEEKEHNKSGEISKEKSKEAIAEKSAEVSAEKSAEKESGHHKETEEKPIHVEETKPSAESGEHSAQVTSNVISYNEIIKCLQTKLQGANSAISPLTYVLIPSFKGPC